tara:strand:- start:3819 stop:3932 length:114 start_codon:yes stop_codon:yes gene_type:complete
MKSIKVLEFSVRVQGRPSQKGLEHPNEIISLLKEAKK